LSVDKPSGKDGFELLLGFQPVEKIVPPIEVVQLLSNNRDETRRNVDLTLRLSSWSDGDSHGLHPSVNRVPDST
jgi:hypothetical protein